MATSSRTLAKSREPSMQMAAAGVGSPEGFALVGGPSPLGGKVSVENVNGAAVGSVAAGFLPECPTAWPPRLEHERLVQELARPDRVLHRQGRPRVDVAAPE